eukprot:1778279-Pyramimonas_sp.AAC.1
MAMRLEMYVAEALWKTLSYSEQCALFTVMREVEDQFHEQLQQWNQVSLPSSNWFPPQVYPPLPPPIGSRPGYILPSLLRLVPAP